MYEVQYKKIMICFFNNVHVKNVLEIFSIIFKLGFVFSCVFCFRSMTCLVRSVYRICSIIKIGIWRSIPFQFCSRMSISGSALNLMKFRKIFVNIQKFRLSKNQQNLIFWLETIFLNSNFMLDMALKNEWCAFMPLNTSLQAL